MDVNDLTCSESTNRVALTCVVTFSFVPWVLLLCRGFFFCAVAFSFMPWLFLLCRGFFFCAVAFSFVP